MKVFLEEYIVGYSKKNTCTLVTENPYLYHRLLGIPDGIVQFGKTDTQTENLSAIVKEYLVNNQTELNLKKLKIELHNNVRDECLNIVASFVGHVMTSNNLVRATLNSILNHYQDNDEVLKINLWIKSAEAIFLLDRIKHIDICCNHPLILEHFKSNLFHKNHIFRNQTIDSFTSSSVNLDPRKKHKFKTLSDIHYTILKLMTEKPIENLLQNLTYPDLTIYQYIRVLEELMVKHEKLLTGNRDIEIISPEELPWCPEVKDLWIAGLSSQSQIDRSFLRGFQGQLVGASSHTFSSGQKVHLDSGFLHCKRVNKVVMRYSNRYVYLAPCPPRSMRKNTFAINHITKLLNNPHIFYVENVLRLKWHNFHPNHILGIVVHVVFEELIKQIHTFKDFEYVRTVLVSLLAKNHFSQVDYVLVLKKSEIMLRHLFDILKNATSFSAEHEGVQKIIHNRQEYFLHGRADLIYEQDRKYGVIDFKTGNPPSWFNIINGSAPQIPIAMLMLKFGGFLDKTNIELGDSGFISPKGLFKMEHDAFILKSAINGISRLITAFWDEERPYYLHINDLNSTYRIMARQIC